MAKKEENNFKKAMNELLGYNEKSPAQESAPEPTMEAEPEVTPEITPEILMPRQEAELPVPREEAIIPSDMVITGNITTKSHMRVLGSIQGDVSCDGNLLLFGSIQGKVHAGNLTIQQGVLTGDAVVRENIIVEQDAVLKGNLSAQNVSTNAQSEGEIRADHAVELRENAYVRGNITAGTLAVHSGAKIKGMVDVSE